MVPIDKLTPLTTIKIPANLNALNAIKFNARLYGLLGADGYCFDFTDLKFAKPFAMLFLAQAIREFLKKHNSNDTCKALIGSEGRAMNACSYMAHMGFFRDAGINYGKDTGEAPGGTNYIPMTEIIFQELFDTNKYQQEQVVLETKSKELASILVQTDIGDAYEVLSYCIRETLRNAFEHSKSDRVRICAQYWPSCNKAQIAILDSGIGVLTSLKENFQFDDLVYDIDALERAVMPAVTSKPLSSNNYDHWGNSGFGLYMLKRICKDSGSFLMSSNQAAINIERSQSAWRHAGLNGTSLKVEIDLNKLISFGTLEESLERYRNDSDVETEPSRSSMGLVF